MTRAGSGFIWAQRFHHQMRPATATRPAEYIVDVEAQRISLTDGRSVYLVSAPQ
jgi:hypothetical protein